MIYNTTISIIIFVSSPYKLELTKSIFVSMLYICIMYAIYTVYNTCVYVYASVYTCVYVYASVYTSMYMYIKLHSTCMYVYKTTQYMYVCMYCICMCMYMYILRYA